MRTAGATAEDTGRRVREAAVTVFAAKGFAAAGLRELAREAGLTPAALYHYMGRKEDLLLEIMRSTIEPLAGAAEDIVRIDAPPEVKLATLAEVHVFMHGARPRATLVADTELRALSGEHRTRMVELRDRYESLWRSVIADGIRTGHFEVGDEAVATIALLDLCNGVSHWYVPEGRLTLHEVCALHADLALGMVRVTRGRRAVRRHDLDLPDPAEVLYPDGDEGHERT